MTEKNFVVITSYVDGKKFGEAVTDPSNVPIVENNFDLNIGGMVGWDSNRWVGGIDDIRLWNVARTASEISQNYNKHIDTPQDGLAFNLDFESSVGSYYNDSVNDLRASIHGNVAATTGAPIDGGSQGIFLDGTDYLSVQDPGTNSALDLGNDFTIEAWCQFGFSQDVWDASQPWGGSQHATILAKNYSHPSTNIQYGVWRYHETSDQDNLALNTYIEPYQGSQYDSNVGSAFVTGISSNTQWHHLAFTYNTVKFDPDSLSISGVSKQGHALTADVMGAQELVGVDRFAISYQWLRNGVEIKDATNVSYSLTQADIGSRISVQFSYLDNSNIRETLVSGETAPVENGNEPPIASASVTISAAESIASGTVIAKASATDPNADTLLYAITAGDPTGIFSINSASGEISVSSGRSLDYEISKQHVLSVTASDGYLTATQGVTIKVMNVSGDVIKGSALSNNMLGTTGNDDIFGLGGNDTLDGKGGNDLLDGGNGNDTVTYASAISDVTVDLRITGPQDTHGAGWDMLVSIENVIGGIDSDSLIGNALANSVDGGDGDDTIDGGAGNDKLTGGADWTDGDTLSYASASGGVKVNLSVITAQVTGGAGTDTIASFENLIGSDFNDKLTGTAGHNVMFGGDGADTITGGLSTDYLTGGAGADVFVFTTIVDSTANSARDQIFDFEAGDKIDLSLIDANTEASGNQAFTFIGSTKFTGLGQLHYAHKNGLWLLEGNTTGNLAPDFQIELRDAFALHVGDVVL